MVECHIGSVLLSNYSHLLGQTEPINQASRRFQARQIRAGGDRQRGEGWLLAKNL